LSRNFIKRAALSVPFGLLALSRDKALTLNRDGMQQLGPRNVFQIFQVATHCIHIMAVDGTIIFKTQRLEKSAGCNSGSYGLLEPGSDLLHLLTRRFKIA